MEKKTRPVAKHTRKTVKSTPLTKQHSSIYTAVVTRVRTITVTQLLVVLLLIAAFLVGSLYTKVSYLEKNGPSSVLGTGTTPAPSTAPQKVNVSTGHFPILGNKDAKVTIVEFADFRCPYCEQFFTSVEPQIMKDYVNTGKAKFAFRQYAFLGPASTVAANAAECANEQGKFWAMHDYFYKNQPAETDTSMYTTDNLTQIAGTLGMDTDKFNSCLSNNTYNDNVSKDMTEGQQAGVSGTPTIFINGTPIVGAEPYSVFKTAIDQALQQS